MNGQTAGQLITTLPFLLLICQKIVDSCEIVVIHKKRAATLGQRVKAVQKVIPLLFDNAQSLRNNDHLNFVLLLKTCLEDKEIFLKRFLKKDRKLAIRVFKYGTDEEEFVKLGERLQFCLYALNLQIDFKALFDKELDAIDFQEDFLHLVDCLYAVVSVLPKQQSKAKIISDKAAKLLEYQNTIRNSYYSNRATDANIEVSENEVEYGDVIGTGSFGEVFKGKYQGHTVAIKKLKSVLSKEALRQFNAEAAMMRRLSHPMTLACFGVCDNEKVHFIIIEYMENKSLQSYILGNKDNALEWNTRSDIALDVSIGMAYLHRLQIVHRSLKSSNILLSKNFKAKVGDFGMSIARTETATIMKVDEFSGASQYMAPECFGISPRYSTKSDIFAFSICLYELSSWTVTFADDDIYEIREFIRSGQRLPIPDNIPKSFTSLITQSWDLNTELRPPFSEILSFLEVIDFSEGVANQETPFKLKMMKKAGETMLSPPMSPRISQTELNPMPLNQSNKQSQSNPSLFKGNEPQEVISNLALQKLWNQFVSTYPQSKSWDTFFEFLPKLIPNDGTKKLDILGIKRKMDIKITGVPSNLKKLHQFVLEADPIVFFSKFMVEPSQLTKSITNLNAEATDPDVQEVDLDMNESKKKGSCCTLL